jgi:hypothetical protein
MLILICYLKKLILITHYNLHNIKVYKNGRHKSIRYIA